MPAPAGAFVMRNAIVTIDAVEYANQCTRAELVPEAETQTLKTLVPDGIVQDVDTNVWALNLTIIQDYVAGQGLARKLTDSHGLQLTATLEPKAGGVGADVTFIAKAVNFGGEQGSFATSEVELPVIGAPTFIDPV